MFSFLSWKDYFLFQVLLGRGRRPSEIILIIDRVLYADVSITEDDLPNLRILDIPYMTFPKLWEAVFARGSTATEECMYVVVGGLHSITEPNPFPSPKGGTVDGASIRFSHLEEKLANYLIHGACNFWSSVLCNTANSDVIFLPVPDVSDNRLLILSGSQKFTNSHVSIDLYYRFYEEILCVHISI